MTRSNALALTFASLALTLFPLGCGLTLATPGPVPAPPLRGHVHGGQQPVTGASMQLFAAGATGYGTGSISLLSSPVLTDSAGNFSLTGDYLCPSASSQLYLVATGGNPGLAPGTNNPALTLMAALGPCQLINGQYTLSPSLFINLDEVTTVAAVTALSPFMSTDAAQIGASSTNALGLANAFAAVNNLTDLSSGQARSLTPAGNGAVPQAELNSLADILAPRVNSNGASPACAALFAAGTPPGGTAPVNTLQAALNIARHPANQAAALFGLISPTSPFQPTLTAAPNDWSVVLSFTAYGSTQRGLAVDASGNLWVSNQFTSNTNLTSSLTELSPLGEVLSGTAGFTGGGLSYPVGVALDPAGNVWAANTLLGGGLSKFSSSGAPLSSTGFHFATEGSFALDGFGNVWIPSGAFLTETDNNGNLVATYTGIGGLQFTPTDISVDGGENIWISTTTATVHSGGGNQVSYNGHVIELTNAGVPLSPFTGFEAPSVYYADFIANDHAGNAWVASRNTFFPPISVTKIASDGTFLSGSAGFMNPSLHNPHDLAIDGDGHVWIATDSPQRLNADLNGSGLLVELDTNGNFLSGPNGYFLQDVSNDAMALDPSGNIWTISGPYVQEALGLAAPVVTPLSLGAKNNTVGTRP